LKHSWTGGQFSLWRALLAGVLCVELVRRVHRAWVDSGAPIEPRIAPWISRSIAPGIGPGIAPWIAMALECAGIVLALMLALGARHRLAALGLAACLLVLREAYAIDVSHPVLLVIALLVLTACTRPAPFLSAPALGRVDPGGSWILSDWLYACAWIVLMATCARDAVPFAERAIWPDGSPQIFTFAWKWLGWLVYLAPLAILPRWLPAVWIALFAFEVYFSAEISGSPHLPVGIALAFLLTVDPGWIAPTDPRAVDTVLFDGRCGLCHRFVRFLLAEDRRGAAFRFAPLDGERARALIPADRRATLPDSVVVLTADGRILTRSRASQRLLSRLGGVWRLVAWITMLCPSAVLDRMYDAIARVRHSVFARPAEACPMLPAHLRRRFDA
jgi:predicted DCC family thiol-disulfide oxidoreductase YuxK